MDIYRLLNQSLVTDLYSGRNEIVFPYTAGVPMAQEKHVPNDLAAAIRQNLVNA